MNRLATIVLLALFAGPDAASQPNASAQPAERWYETELADLRQPSKAVSLTLTLDGSFWFHPFDPVDWVRLFARAPVQLIVAPPVELASWIDHHTINDPGRRDEYRDAQRKILRTPDDAGWTDETIERLNGFGGSFTRPSKANAEAARHGLRNASFIGRLQEVQVTLEPRVVLIENLRVPGGFHPGGATFVGELILIDVGRTAAREPDELHIAHRGWLETYAHELGHVFWYTLTDEERSAFERRFWPDGKSPSGATVSGYARTNPGEDFAESFKIAVLYPTTYDSASVTGHDILRPWTDTPMHPDAIERVRYVDDLLTAKSPRPHATATLRDNRFSRMLNSSAQPEETEDDTDTFDLRDAINRRRGD